MSGSVATADVVLVTSVVLQLSGDALRSPCVLLVPEKESPRAGDGAVGSIDFALYVTAGAAQPPASARGPSGAPEGDVSGDVSGDVEIGALGEPAPAAANRAVGAGSLLVASSGRLFNCMEVFGPLQVRIGGLSAAPAKRCGIDYAPYAHRTGRSCRPGERETARLRRVRDLSDGAQGGVAGAVSTPVRVSLLLPARG